jgi:hypothetical protein
VFPSAAVLVGATHMPSCTLVGEVTTGSVVIFAVFERYPEATGVMVAIPGLKEVANEAMA